MSLRPASDGNRQRGRLVVELRRTGITLVIPPELTVLEELENRGVEVASLCCAGICGTCETRVLGAEFTGAQAPGSLVSRHGQCVVRLCVANSGSLTRLILDL